MRSGLAGVDQNYDHRRMRPPWWSLAEPKQIGEADGALQLHCGRQRSVAYFVVSARDAGRADRFGRWLALALARGVAALAAGRACAWPAAALARARITAGVQRVAGAALTGALPHASGSSRVCDRSADQAGRSASGYGAQAISYSECQ